MEIVPCSFCKHGNPADAKFCNACGSSLSLQLCEACGAIDNIDATACHKCGRPFSPRSHPVAADVGTLPGSSSASSAGESAHRTRSPGRLIALLALIIAGTLVIYPRVAGDQAAPAGRSTPTQAGPVAEPDPVPAESHPGSQPASAPQSPPPAAAEAVATADATQPPTAASAAEAVSEEAERSPEAASEALAKTPSPVEIAAPPEQGEVAAPTPAAPAAALQAGDEPPGTERPETSTADAPETPAGCSPAIDALGLCPRGFR